MSLIRDRYLDDHRIDGKAVLPGVMGLETMAQMTRAVKGKKINSMLDVAFNTPVKLPKDNDLEIITFAERIGSHIQTELKSKFLGPDGKQLGELRPHFSARMITGRKIPG